MTSGESPPDNSSGPGSRPIWVLGGPHDGGPVASPTTTGTTAHETTVTKPPAATGTRRVQVETRLDGIPQQRRVPPPAPHPPSPSAALPGPSTPVSRRHWLLAGGGAAAVLLVVGLFVLSTMRSETTGTSTVATSTGTSASTASSAVVPPYGSSPYSGTSPYSGISAAPATSLVQAGADLASDPSASDVVSLLDRHFSAINSGDFAGWSATVTPRRASSITPNDWLRGYSTTVDSDVVALRTRTGTDGRQLVDVSFTSTQATTSAPPDLPVGRICWTSSWPLTDVSGRTVIDSPAKGATTKRAC